MPTKTTKTTPKKPKRNNKPKKTPQLLQQVKEQRKLKKSFNQIAEELNLNKSTVREWCHGDDPGLATNVERNNRRIEETELTENIQRMILSDLAQLHKPLIEPDWEKYERSAMARAEAYRTWMKAKEGNIKLRLAAYNSLFRSIDIMKTLNGLAIKDPIIVEHRNDVNDTNLTMEILKIYDRFDELEEQKNLEKGQP